MPRLTLEKKKLQRKLGWRNENAVQPLPSSPAMTEANVKVGVRWRPLMRGELAADRSGADGGLQTNEKGFAAVFDGAASNRDVYAGLVEPVVSRWVDDGFNGTVLAYGQTGSGKTHTLFGHADTAHLGVVRHMVADVFERLHAAGQPFAMRASFFEVYRERVRDLLWDVGGREVLSIREDESGFFVDGAVCEPVASADDVLELLARGNANKTMGHSHVHDMSSRSHTVFHCVLARRTPAGAFQVSELNLVDLAGAEALSGDFGAEQQEETKAINLSLLALRAVIQALANRDKFVPYRESVLTKLLANSFGGNSLTTLLVTVSPAEVHAAMSRRSIAFGCVTQKVRNRIRRGRIGPKVVKMRTADQVATDTTVVNLKHVAASAGKTKAGKKKRDASPAPVSGDDVPAQVLLLDGSISCVVAGAVDAPLVLLLHAHGATCSGWDWKAHIPGLVRAGCRVVAPSFPGFGDSPGRRHPSRAERVLDRDGPVAVVNRLLTALGATAERPAVVVGYHWGGAIALGLATEKTRRLRHVVAFHAPWPNDDLARLNAITVPVLLLAVPSDQFHPMARSTATARAIKTAKLVKLDVGAYGRDKSSGYYACVSEQIVASVARVLPQSEAGPEIDNGEEEDEDVDVDEDQGEGEIAGDEEEADATPVPLDGSEDAVLLDLVSKRSARSLSKRKAAPAPDAASTGASVVLTTAASPPEGCTMVEAARWAVQRWRELLRAGKADEYYTAVISSTTLRPEAVRLFGSLPILAPGTLTPAQMAAYDIWPEPPVHGERLAAFPRYAPGRQVLCRAPVHRSVTATDADGNEAYLAFDAGARGTTFVTHRAEIVAGDGDPASFRVLVDGSSEPIDVSRADVYALNEPTNFAGGDAATGDGMLFEDGMRANFSHLVTRAKLLEAAFAVEPVVRGLDLFPESADEQETVVRVQQEAVRQIRRVIDLLHQDHDGLDRMRFKSGQGIGHLAVHGTGNCHTWASVMAAFLLPFAPLLGFEVRFRAGSVVKSRRDVDPETLEPVGAWDGVPRDLEDHTWLEVTMVPSLVSFVCDPSSHQICLPLDLGYSRFGGRHVNLLRRPCNSAKVKAPLVAQIDDVSVPDLAARGGRLFWPRGERPVGTRPALIRWAPKS